MKAILTTRCGCTKMIDILHPVNSIRIPLPTPVTYSPGMMDRLAPEANQMPIREFRISGDVYAFNDTHVPIYNEIL